MNKLTFYQANSKLGDVVPTPASSGQYSYTWNNVGVGTYVLKTAAVDNTGLTKTSSEISVKVIPKPVVVGIDDAERSDAILSSYPNPFVDGFTVKFHLKSKGETSVVLYDIMGREISDVVNENLPAGTHYRTIEGKVLPPGMYLIKLATREGLFNNILYKK